MAIQNLKDITKQDEAKLVLELNSLGLKVNSVYDLVNSNSNYSVAYPILVKHLDIKHHPRIKEGIVRALTVKDAKDIAGKKLLDMFYLEQEKMAKWVLANALKTVLPLKDRKNHPEIKETLGF